MSILTTAELAAYVQETEDAVPMQIALDDAEAAVAAHLGAVDLIFESGATDTLRKGMTGFVLPMSKGLVVAVSAMTIGGTAIDTDDVQTDWWAISYSPGIGKNAEVAVTFDRGFADSSELPAKLLQALLFTSRWTWEEGHQGRQVTSERIGDYAATYGDIAKSQYDAVPDHAQNLLREYVRPTL